MDDFTVQNTQNEETIPSEAEQTTEESQESATTPTEEQDTGASGEESSESSAEEAVEEGETEEERTFLTVKFNKEEKGLSEDEAKAWAQKGMHYEKSYNALSRLAAARGEKIDEFLDNLDKAERNSYEQDLRDKYGDDDELIGKLMDLYDRDRADKISAAEQEEANRITAEKENLTKRIADEFAVLQKEFPELNSIDALPKKVLKSAHDGMPLGYAYLLHKHFEEKKKTDAQNAAEAAKKASTGAVETDKKEEEGMDAFQRAFWSS